VAQKIQMRRYCSDKFLLTLVSFIHLLSSFFSFAFDFLEYILSHRGYESILEVITSTFSSSVQLLIDGKGAKTSNLGVTLYSMEAIFPSILQNEKLTKTLLPVIFNLAYLVPLAIPESPLDFDITPSQVASKGLWEIWIDGTCEAKKSDILQEVVSSLGEFMMDSNVYPL